MKYFFIPYILRPMGESSRALHFLNVIIVLYYCIQVLFQSLFVLSLIHLFIVRFSRNVFHHCPIPANLYFHNLWHKYFLENRSNPLHWMDWVSINVNTYALDFSHQISNPINNTGDGVGLFLKSQDTQTNTLLPFYCHLLIIQ